MMPRSAPPRPVDDRDRVQKAQVGVAQVGEAAETSAADGCQGRRTRNSSWNTQVTIAPEAMPTASAKRDLAQAHAPRAVAPLPLLQRAGSRRVT